MHMLFKSTVIFRMMDEPLSKSEHSAKKHGWVLRHTVAFE